jgi:hypothetical protein
MHVDVGPAGGWTGRGVELLIRGAARDVRGENSGEFSVLTQAGVEAKFDRARVLETLETRPDAPWAQAMVGQRAGGGFRRQLEEVAIDDAAGSLVRQLLEDLPAAALISGYSSLRLAQRLGGEPGALTPPNVLGRMTDMCSGWRAGGTAVNSIAAGEGVPVQECPPAPDLTVASPGSWHEIPPLELDWMRRRRMIDVEPDVEPDGGTGGARIWAMFRDTVGDVDNSELILHEYSLSGRLEWSPEGMVIASLEADPHVLPFVECPAAAPEVQRLSGTLLSRMAAEVPEVLFSVASCTHLNDLLRSIGGMAGLLAAS